MAGDKRKRPVVLMDQDGPISGFDTKFYGLCDANGWALHSTPDTQCHRYASDCILDPDHARLARTYVHQTRWFRDLPPVEGAVDGMHRLAELADVWIVTKPLEANRRCRDDKAAWVEEHLGDDWLRRLIITPDKSLVHGDLLVDDAPRTRWFDKATWRPVIFAAPWNHHGSDWEGLPRWTWADGVELLVEWASETAR